MFKIYGSYGTLTVSDNGEVTDCTAETEEGEDSPEYSDIVRVDVAEWQREYPGESLENGSHDILDFGFWDANGRYFAPDADWREEFQAERKRAEG